jgi:hypothetical protein
MLQPSFFLWSLILNYQPHLSGFNFNNSTSLLTSDKANYLSVPNSYPSRSCPGLSASFPNQSNHSPPLSSTRSSLSFHLPTAWDTRQQRSSHSFAHFPLPLRPGSGLGRVGKVEHWIIGAFSWIHRPCQYRCRDWDALELLRSSLKYATTAPPVRSTRDSNPGPFGDYAIAPMNHVCDTMSIALSRQQRSPNVSRRRTSAMRKPLVLGLLAWSASTTLAQSCISLAESTTCSAFNASSISTNSDLIGL